MLFWKCQRKIVTSRKKYLEMIEYFILGRGFVVVSCDIVGCTLGHMYFIGPQD
jgi:hypothetical protein